MSEYIVRRNDSPNTGVVVFRRGIDSADASCTKQKTRLTPPSFHYD